MNQTVKFTGKTVGGAKVDIFTTIANDPQGPVVGEYQHEDGTWQIAVWQADGRFAAGKETHLDLEVEKPVRVTRWLWAYQRHGGWSGMVMDSQFLTEEEARACILGVVKLEWSATEFPA